MASVILNRDILISGTSYTRGATVSVSLSFAYELVGCGARWASVASVRNLSTEADRIVFLSEITDLTGGAPSGLDCLLIASVPVGRMFDVQISGENAPRRYKVIAKNGETPDADSIIEPPDFDATGCNKLLLRIQ
jgi:hypothetical protein